MGAPTNGITEGAPVPTLMEIKKSIPEQYFRSNVWLSLYYVARSALFVGLSFLFVWSLTSQYSSICLESTVLKTALVLIYALAQGTVFWGIFTLGHDCGHRSFSKSEPLNLFFGCILHSFLLVPYVPWKLTHNHHHKHTGDIDHDEVFYPHRTNVAFDWVRRLVVFSMGFAWFIYLYGRRHFYPKQGDTIFKSHELDVAISHSSWMAMLALVLYSCYRFGIEQVFVYYFMPLLVFASWIVITTFLHHADEDVPWYAGEEWTYVKGNLSSVDRDYGYGINNVIHNIGTHQVHHLFPIIPHYYLVEATEHFRAAFPHLVRKSDDSKFYAFFKNVYLYYKYGHSVPVEARVFRYKDQVAKENSQKISVKTKSQ